MQTGDNFFAVPILQANYSVRSIIGTAAPAGTTVSLWNSTANTWSPVSVYEGGVWSEDLTLDLGEGAKVTTPSPFTLWLDGGLVSHGPNPFTGPPGTYLLGDVCFIPLPLAGDEVFQHVLGRAPVIGDQFSRLDAVTQTYINSTFGSSGWDVTPTLSVGEAGFFMIPEPSASALIMVGGLLLCALRRRS